MSGMIRISMTRMAAAAGAALMGGLFAVPAVAADRPSDKDVKQLLERIDHERDRFEDQLDGKLKRSIVRGPGGEVDVERYLDDLQDNVDKLKDRFTAQCTGQRRGDHHPSSGLRHPPVHVEPAAQSRRRQRMESSGGEPRRAGDCLRHCLSTRRWTAGASSERRRGQEGRRGFVEERGSLQEGARLLTQE